MNRYNHGNPSPNYSPMYNENGLLQTLLNAMQGEASAVDFYSRLADMTTNQKDKQEILKIVEDEKAHLQSFVNLYFTLTGRHPQYQPTRVGFNSFEEGIQEAFEDELKDYETYRNQYLKTRNQTIRDVFLRAFTDEIKHATRFSMMKSSQSVNTTEATPSVPQITKVIRDYGPDPFVVNIDEMTKRNEAFRTALWTGQYLQLTLMSINVGEDIGIEMHPDTDQFLRIEEGQGIVRMGDNENQFDFEEDVFDDYVILVPAGTWHNVINTGEKPLKIYSIYAPPHHPQGTVHETKADVIVAEAHEVQEER